MALLEMEGFDHRQKTPTRPGVQYIGNGGFGVGGRFGVGGYLGGDVAFGFTLPTPLATVVAGVAVFVPPTGAYLKFVSVSVNHLYISYNNSTSRFELYRGDGTLLGTSSSTFSGSTWRYIEMKATIADSGGTAEVHVDGTVQISYTGDTRNGANANVDQIITMTGNVGQQIDDFYCLDTTGPAPYNDFLGDVRVETLVPNADGAFSQLVGSDGNSVSNWQQVDEIPPASSDYNGSSTPGQRDTYGCTDLVTTSGQALAVRVTAFTHKANAGNASFKPITRLSGTERLEAAQTLSATANTPVSGALQTVDPSNATWTIANVNAAEFGVEVA